MSHTFSVKTFVNQDRVPLRYGLLRPAEGQPSRLLIFIPGLGGSMKGALAFLERLLPEDGMAIGLDARGFGLNQDIAKAPHPGLYLKDLEEWLSYYREKQQENYEHTVICGLSFGGVLTHLYMTQGTHGCDGAILLAPAYKPNPHMFDLAFRLKAYAKACMTLGLGRITMPYGTADLTRNEEKRQDPNCQTRLVLPIFYLLLVDLLCQKAMNTISQVTLPVAVVVPEEDRICSPDAMSAVAEALPHEQSVAFRYKHMFHDVMEEPIADQDAMCQDLQQWLSSNNLF